MSYAVYDLSESLDRAEIRREDVELVDAAWGGSPEGYASWEGGFLLKLKDGRWAYLSGWCDTTGWGCQDGVEVVYFDIKPDLASLNHSPMEGTTGEDWERWDDPSEGWDQAPVDLNRFIRGEIGSFE